MAGKSRSFSESEVEAILARAIEHAETGKSKLSLEDLVAVGAEVGVPRAAIEHAAAEVTEDAPEESPAGTSGTEDAALKALRARVRAGWFRHLFAYLAVNAFLVFVNLMTDPSTLWFVWPLAGWGLGVVLSARRVFFMPDDEARQFLSRKERRRAKKEAKKERKMARKLPRTRVAELDDAQLRARIDARVDAVLAERALDEEDEYVEQDAVRGKRSKR